MPQLTDIANHIVILTGAGVSVGSGLPTYRGPGGLWESADIARIVEARFLPGSLPDLWRLYSERRRVALAAEPNPAHHAVARLQNARPGAVTLLTQNVDGLHQRADSPQVTELHGSAFRTRCTNPACGLPPFDDTRSYDAVPLPCWSIWRREKARNSSTRFTWDAPETCCRSFSPRYRSRRA